MDSLPGCLHWKYKFECFALITLNDIVEHQVSDNGSVGAFTDFANSNRTIIWYLPPLLMIVELVSAMRFIRQMPLLNVRLYFNLPNVGNFP